MLEISLIFSDLRFLYTIRMRVQEADWHLMSCEGQGTSFPLGGSDRVWPFGWETDKYQQGEFFSLGPLCKAGWTWLKAWILEPEYPGLNPTSVTY